MEIYFYQLSWGVRGFINHTFASTEKLTHDQFAAIFNEAVEKAGGDGAANIDGVIAAIREKGFSLVEKGILVRVTDVDPNAVRKVGPENYMESNRAYSTLYSKGRG